METAELANNVGTIDTIDEILAETSIPAIQLLETKVSSGVTRAALPDVSSTVLFMQNTKPLTKRIVLKIAKECG